MTSDIHKAMDRPTKVSVAIIAHNEQQYIAGCIRSLLNQNFMNFELIVVDDCSSDNTGEIVLSFDDQRIRYIRADKQLGYAKARNTSLEFCGGEYVFFTDADCTVKNDWIEQGLRLFDKSDCAAVEGKIYYVSEDYIPSYSDGMAAIEKPGHFRTANIAYRKEFIERVGGFDEEYTYCEDRNLALKVIQARGVICFNPEMIVYHPQLTVSIKEFVLTANRIKNKIRLFKEFHDRAGVFWRIVDPRGLVVCLLPPTILGSLLINRFDKLNDFKLLPFLYVRDVYERFCIWRECIKEQVFLI
jgi:glycosyltransferase involved in cell wall biosynthesis